jgi:dipeptidyl aminopeptidase/acylaminoacyl peptidase
MGLREWLTICRKLTQRRKGAKAFCALLFVVAFGVPVRAQRGMTAADTLRVAAVGDPQISPDGGLVVYTVSTTEEGGSRTALWLARADDARRGPEVLLPAEWNASRPRWSPDGRRLAFVASRNQQSGLWVVALADRRPRFVAEMRSSNFHIPYAGETFSWSPDGRRIAYVHATEEGADAGGAVAATTDARRDDPRDDPRVVERIQYKSRTGFSDRLRPHVWVTDVDNPAPRQLTSGPYYDHAVAYSTRADEIAFLSNREPDPDAVNNSDIFAVALDGRVRQLTSTKGCEYEPTWSPDGRLIAHTATTRDVTTIDSVAEDTHVWTVEVASGERRELARELDRRARSPRFSPDGRAVFFTAGDRGQTFIYRAGVNDARAQNIFAPLMAAAETAARGPGGEIVTFGERRLRPFQVGAFTVGRAPARLRPPAGSTDAGGQLLTLALTASDALNPAEVFVQFTANVPAARPVFPLQLSDHNRQFLRSLGLSEPEELTFRSFDNTRVQGWLMKPLGWRDGDSSPLILSVHGGPHGMFGYGFNAAFQAYAARGYAVLFINPRGSTGYGQKFSDGTLREWGGGDYRDLMAGVDEALKKYPWIDRNRMGVTGGSYGGFMTNWIVTQTTRFRAAVASASVSNLVSFYATSLYQDLIHAEFGGFPWDDYELLWRWSPVRYVRDAQTPLLLIHGELDNDVHITQAEEMYTALRRRGVETALVRYPREGHGFREPRHRVDALERTLAWFDRFLK